MSNEKKYEQFKKEIEHFKSELFRLEKEIINLIFEFEKIVEVIKEWDTTKS